ncbi:MAG TPA: shikimate kinase [Candidatus Acidoferrales bacterium]|nr:shikimate kinase [Candidatus Acidoferrales bacterium]
MTDHHARRIICLSGFMGSGKSTTGRLLARQAGWPHVDLDKRVIEAAGQSIPEIFAKLGEPAFRDIEHRELARALDEAVGLGQPRIISLGGGTVTQARNLALLREKAAVLVWLRCAIEELLARCAQITDRPLFRDEASFRQLYSQRLPSYELSDYVVESGGDPMHVVERIIALGVFPKVTV